MERQPRTAWQIEQDKERKTEAKVRNLMMTRRITYQEAEHMIKNGQKGIFDFR